eukprot:764300-Hanusia_phi.AAC.3
MDLQAIYSALAATLSPNQKEREAAEALLKNFEGTPGYISSLFRVVNSNEVSIEIKQAGIIYFKNLVGIIPYRYVWAERAAGEQALGQNHTYRRAGLNVEALHRLAPDTVSSGLQLGNSRR